MPVYVSDLLTATAAPVNAAPTATRTWQWLRGSTAISGATSSTYTAVTADIGATIAASQIETNVAGSATATSAPTEVIQAFDPIRLFSASEPGVWYDPNDISTLFQDAAGTIPVTGPVGPAGQPVPVGLMLDKSRGGRQALPTTGWAKTSGDGTVIVDGNTITITGATTTTRVDVAAPGWAVGDYADMTVTGSVAGATGPLLFLGGADAYSVPNGTSTFRNVIRSSNLLRVQISAGSATFVVTSRGYATGNHATQSTTASQPIYGIVPAGGRRNLFRYSQDFSNSGTWAKSGTATVTLGQTDPLGGTTAAKVEFASIFQYHGQSYTFVGGETITHSVWLRGDAAGTIRFADASGGAWGKQVSISTAWQRFDVTATSVPAAARIVSVTTGAGDLMTVYVAFEQLELGSTATPYQRVTTQYDVTEAGVASLGYLRFDGTDDFMRTTRMPTIAQPYQMWAALEPTAFVAANYTYIFDGFDGTNRAYLAFAGGTGSTTTGNYRMAAVTEIASATILSAGSRYVATASFSGAASEVRSNGVSVLTGDAGTGSFDGLTIGTRFSNSSYQNGKFFGGIVHGGAVTAARINATEAWLNDRTGAY